MTAKSSSSSNNNNKRRDYNHSTLYYNDTPSSDPSNSVWIISSLFETCASGMQLLGQSCDHIQPSKNSNTCHNMSPFGGDATNTTSSSHSHNNNIIYKRKEEGRRRHSSASSNSNNNNHNTITTAVVGEDFSILHDDFLESLLYEASQERENSNHSVCMDESLSSQSSAGLFSRLDSTNTLEETETRHMQQQEEEERIAAARKRRRPLRLRKKNSPPLQNNQSQHLYQSFAPQEGGSSNNAYQQNQPYAMNDSGASSPVKRKTTDSIEFNLDLHNSRDEPHVFLHEHVRMQKDKGKGEPVGSNICAKGRQPCLSKLRAKMRLLTEVALKDVGGGGGSGGGAGGAGACSSSNASTASSVTTATMKRKKARIALQTETFCETRSLIELKMGFLSMTYGVLLRWDTTRTRTITLVVLRKNCHESFYPRLLNNNSSSLNENQQYPSKRHKELTNTNNKNASSSSNGSSSSRHGSRQRSSRHGLDPPYIVPRPLDFSPTILQVSVLYATGLNKRCNWTVQLLLEHRVESILLAYDADRDRLYPKLGEALRQELSNASFTPSLPLLPPALEIKLWEHAQQSRGRRNNNSRRLVCAMRVSWDDLPISKSSSHNRKNKSSCTTARMDSTLVTVPCLHDVENATIGLDVLFQSDYLAWLSEELQARHQRPPTPVPSNISSLPRPRVCTGSDVVLDGCSPLLECASQAITTTTPPPSSSTRYECRGAISPQEQHEEEEEDVNSPWEWICSVC